jgi:hypothetical protein
MSDENKEYSNEMRGSLFENSARTGDKSPIGTGTITISGVELRIAMWPSKMSKDGSKKFWPIVVEYNQGTEWMLVKVAPKDVVATTGTAEAPGGDMPF